MSGSPKKLDSSNKNNLRNILNIKINSSDKEPLTKNSQNNKSQLEQGSFSPNKKLYQQTSLIQETTNIFDDMRHRFNFANPQQSQAQHSGLSMIGLALARLSQTKKKEIDKMNLTKVNVRDVINEQDLMKFNYQRNTINTFIKTKDIDHMMNRDSLQSKSRYQLNQRKKESNHQKNLVEFNSDKFGCVELWNEKFYRNILGVTQFDKLMRKVHRTNMLGKIKPKGYTSQKKLKPALIDLTNPNIKYLMSRELPTMQISGDQDKGSITKQSINRNFENEPSGTTHTWKQVKFDDNEDKEPKLEECSHTSYNQKLQNYGNKEGILSKKFNSTITRNQKSSSNYGNRDSSQGTITSNGIQVSKSMISSPKLRENTIINKQVCSQTGSPWKKKYLPKLISQETDYMNFSNNKNKINHSVRLPRAAYARGNQKFDRNLLDKPKKSQQNIENYILIENSMNSQINEIDKKKSESSKQTTKKLTKSTSPVIADRIDLDAKTKFFRSPPTRKSKKYWNEEQPESSKMSWSQQAELSKFKSELSRCIPKNNLPEKHINQKLDPEVRLFRRMLSTKCCDEDLKILEDQSKKNKSHRKDVFDLHEKSYGQYLQKQKAHSRKFRKNYSQVEEIIDIIHAQNKTRNRGDLNSYYEPKNIVDHKGRMRVRKEFIVNSGGGDVDASNKKQMLYNVINDTLKAIKLKNNEVFDEYLDEV